MTMGTTTVKSASPGGDAVSSIPPVPLGTLLKTAAADPKTTNTLLLIVVLCMSGYMPEAAMTLCGS